MNENTNLDYERALVGQLIEKPDLLDRAEVFADLFTGERREIVAAVRRLRTKTAKIDSIVLANELESMAAEIASCTSPTTANWTFYANNLADLYRKRKLDESLSKAKALRDEGRHGEAIEGLTRDLSDLSGRRPSRRPFGEELEDKRKRDAERDPMVTLGYRLNRFRQLSRDIDGLQSGFYIFGAATNVGKTAILTNLLLDALEANPEVQAVYVSLDDPRDTIVNRLLAQLSGLTINTVRRKVGGGDADKLAKAYDALTAYAEAGRLDVRDIADVDTADALEAYIRGRIFDPDRPNLIVFLDALYNLETGTDAATIREANIERANWLKRLVGTYRVPVLTTGELRKDTAAKKGKPQPPSLSDLMETGKYSYAADLVVLLYPEDDDRFRDDPEPVLVLDYAKNKLSDYRGKRSARFDKARSIVTMNDPV